MVNSANQVDQEQMNDARQHPDDPNFMPMYNNSKHRFSSSEIADLWQEFREFDEHKSFGLCFEQLQNLMVARARTVFPHSPSVSSATLSEDSEERCAVGEVNPYLQSPVDMGKHAAERMWDRMIEINPGKKKMSFAEFLEWNERYSDTNLLSTSPASTISSASPVRLIQKDEQANEEDLRQLFENSRRKSFPGFAGIMRKKRQGKRSANIEDLKTLPRVNPPPSPTRLLARGRSGRNSATSSMWGGDAVSSSVTTEQAEPAGLKHSISEPTERERFRALTVDVGKNGAQVERDNVTIDRPYTRSLDSIPKELTREGEVQGCNRSKHVLTRKLFRFLWKAQYEHTILSYAGPELSVEIFLSKCEEVEWGRRPELT
ncbi:hypothetical protein GUITHDRAFT_110663 [Guillardia theta CCMP2712]|uniref:Uncharacterized protein n=1 Tax=Guillardia theta (strain CCMP2712) TaxID=905079 RepID=L1J4J7_GUITC|nr:hypothetical protein GUITHDRAFT_110663 [Guillardia theta CCMP2712]EKX43247.1 hypothetical protein GUITHDRAFT_110663 [Guillardia theta CCMP2712]|eukprot:XP_005830227.1 hypothetical protein GUITHDRAFT_110663 [Guillardia theta CCMP2712]